MRKSPSITGVGLKSNASVLIKDTEAQTDREGKVTMEAEVAVMWP